MGFIRNSITGVLTSDRILTLHVVVMKAMM